MGEAFISKKRERFQHQNDAAKERDLETEDLFSVLPDVSSTVYRCVLTSDVAPEPSDSVAVAELESGILSVLLRNTVIGHVKSADAKQLKTFLASSHHKMLVGIVDSVRLLSRSFTIRLT